MSDDSRALATGPSQQSEAEYNAIRAALMETARGRAFLAEHERRSRSADIAALIAASERIEATMREQRAAGVALPDQSAAASNGHATDPTRSIDQRVPPVLWLEPKPAAAPPTQPVPVPADTPSQESPSSIADGATANDDLADLLFEPGMPPAPARPPIVDSMPDRTETHTDTAKPANGTAAAAKPVRQTTTPAPRSGDPLAPLKAMSDEERIALFS